MPGRGAPSLYSGQLGRVETDVIWLPNGHQIRGRGRVPGFGSGGGEGIRDAACGDAYFEGDALCSRDMPIGHRDDHLPRSVGKCRAHRQVARRIDVHHLGEVGPLQLHRDLASPRRKVNLGIWIEPSPGYQKHQPDLVVCIRKLHKAWCPAVIGLPSALAIEPKGLPERARECLKISSIGREPERILRGFAIVFCRAREHGLAPRLGRGDGHRLTNLIDQVGRSLAEQQREGVGEHSLIVAVGTRWPRPIKRPPRRVR